MGVSLDKLSSLTYLTFGTEFNQPLRESLSKLINVRELTVRGDYEYKEDLPQNIKILYNTIPIQE